MKKSEARKTLDREMKSFGRRMSVLSFEEYLATSQFGEASLRLIENRRKAKAHQNPSLRNVLLRDGIMGSSAVGTDVTGGVPVRFQLAGNS
jgi:hypothetical protein